MNIEVLRRRVEEARTEMQGIVDRYAESEEDFSEEDQTRFDELTAAAKADRGLIQKHEKRIADLAELDVSEENTDNPETRTAGFNTNVKRNPYDLEDIRFGTSAANIRAKAQTAVEGDETLDDDVKRNAISTLMGVDVRGELAMLMLATGSTEYRTGFQKLVSGNQIAITDAERAALTRAQSLSNGAGGFAVPFTLDPTILLTNSGAINPMRRLADIKRTTTGEWNGVTSAGATANWRAEADEADDDSITLVQPNIPVHKMDIFVPYSFEIEMDWVNLENDLRMVMADAKDRLEATAHFTGSGSGQPTGIITALDGGSSEVAPQTGETFAAEDVYNLRRQLPARHRATREMVDWVGTLGTYDTIRQFDTSGGGDFWADMTDGTPDRLLGLSAHETTEMDDANDINAAATADNHILLIGNFKRFCIVDQLGMRVESIPHIFGSNNRPTGQRGIYAVARTGSDSIDDSAFRVLNVATTA